MRNHNRRKEDLCSPTSPRPGSFKACPTVPVYHLCDCTSVPLSQCNTCPTVPLVPLYQCPTVPLYRHWEETEYSRHPSLLHPHWESHLHHIIGDEKLEMVLEFTLKSLTVTHISIKHPPGVGHPPHISRRYSVFRDLWKQMKHQCHQCD